MRSTFTISAVLLTAMILPAAVFAEEGSGSGIQAGSPPKMERPAGMPFGDRGRVASGTMPKKMDGRRPGLMASGTMPMSKDVEERMKERDEMHAKMAASSTEKRDEMKQKMLKQRMEILAQFSATMIKRMEAAIKRLEKIADRLDSRIAKEKARGVDTGKAEANLAIARVKIADAHNAVTLAANLVSSTTINTMLSSTSTKPAETGKPVREALDKAKDAVGAAHKALVEAIASLTGEVGTGKDSDEHHDKSNASTTANTSASSSVSN